MKNEDKNFVDYVHNLKKFLRDVCIENPLIFMAQHVASGEVSFQVEGGKYLHNELSYDVDYNDLYVKSVARRLVYDLGMDKKKADDLAEAFLAFTKIEDFFNEECCVQFKETLEEYNTALQGRRPFHREGTTSIQDRFDDYFE